MIVKKKLQNSTGSDGQQATGEILVPPTAVIGQTRLRVVKYYDEYTPTACLYEQGWYGQVEDYTLNVGDLSALNFDASQFRAYPNPVVDIIKVDYDKTLSGVEVFNVMGQKVFTQQLSSNQADINLSTLTPGTYLMKVSAIDGSAKAIKVVKQ